MCSAVSGAKSEGGKSPYFGGAGCSMGIEPIDGISIFLGWRQQSMLEKVRNGAVSSVSSEPPVEDDG